MSGLRDEDYGPCIWRRVKFLEMKIKEAARSLAPRQAQDEVYFNAIC